VTKNVFEPFQTEVTKWTAVQIFFLCMSFDGIVAHQPLQWTPVDHPIHWHRVPSRCKKTNPTKMADGKSEMPNCSRKSTHSF